MKKKSAVKKRRRYVARGKPKGKPPKALRKPSHGKRFRGVV